MKLPVIIACLLLTAAVYADQTKDADNTPIQGQVQNQSPAPSPTWAGADAGPSANDDEGLEPSYSDTDEPPFGEDGEHE